MPLEAAAKHPLTPERLAQQLGRLGNTHYALADLDVRLRGDCHLPVSEINRLRRALVEALDACETPQVTLPDVSPAELLPSLEAAPTDTPTHLAVLCRSLPQVAAAVTAKVPAIYCDFEDPRRYREAVMMKQDGHAEGLIHLATPRIIKPGELGYLKLIERAEPDGLLLRNLSALHYYRDRSDFLKVGDFSLNVANPITASLLRESAALDRLTVSYDLNIGQVLALLARTPPSWMELTLHQHMPMFHMEHCVFCTFMSEGTSYRDCGRPCEKHVVHLRDRVGQLHRLHADVGCRNTLFNGRAQTGAGFFDALRRSGLRHYRIELLDEDEPAALRTIRAYQQLLAGELEPSELLRSVAAQAKLGITEGTLKS
jgi:putative protease